MFEEKDDVFLGAAASGHREVDGAVGGEINKNAKEKDVKIDVEEWGAQNRRKLEIDENGSLAELLREAGEVLGKEVLPPLPAAPLDLLRGRLQRGTQWSEPIADLTPSLESVLGEKYKKDFSVEYLLVVKINAIWGLAPSANTTPRQLLAAFGMEANEFTLYPPDSDEPYPVDKALVIQRGQAFIAQKDGRYGDGLQSRERRARGTQTIEEDVLEQKEAGRKVRLLSSNDQTYVEAKELDVTSPPWGSTQADILIAVSATYPFGGLDAFYLGLPMSHESGEIPRQQGAISVDGRDWMLISWHYHDANPWNPAQDDLSTHIEHCRGYFLTRGVRQ